MCGCWRWPSVLTVAGLSVLLGVWLVVPRAGGPPRDLSDSKICRGEDFSFGVKLLAAAVQEFELTRSEISWSDDSELAVITSLRALLGEWARKWKQREVAVQGALYYVTVGNEALPVGQRDARGGCVIMSSIVAQLAIARDQGMKWLPARWGHLWRLQQS
jgi:hypothetical protein